MRRGWAETPFAQAPLQIIDGDRGKAYPQHTDFSNEGYCLFLSAANVKTSGFDFSECQFITQHKDEQLRKGRLSRSDVVLTTRGTLGNTAMYSEAVPYDHVRINSGMVIMRTDQNTLLPSFLYCFLRSPGFKQQVEQFRSGVAQPQLPIRDINRIKLPLPHTDVQGRVVQILNAYDDLIENNRRRMQLLEESARLLHQEWFLRLRFPGHEHTRITNAVPEGWRSLPLKDICPDLREAANPADLEADTPYIGLEHMPRRSITLNEWGRAEVVTSTKLRYRAGDILFGKIRPYFHKVGLALTDGVASSDAIVLRPASPVFHSFSLLTVSSDWFVKIVSKTAKEGSKMPRADWNLMEDHPLLIPPGGILDALNETIEPITEQLRTLSFANRKLRAARDLLLPRLMSGEIAV